MVPMLDSMLAAPGATTLLVIGPGFLGVAIALVAGVVWMTRGTAEELRRTAVSDPERRTLPAAPPSPSRLAA